PEILQALIPHYETGETDNSHAERLEALGDGFYCFFSELNRVLVPGALVHIIVPYALSTGAFQVPTHRRFMTPDSFGYLVPNPDAPFQLTDAGKWQIETITLGLGAPAMEESAKYQALADAGTITAEDAARMTGAALHRGLQTTMNHVSEFYIRLRCTK